jgi:hypothetical protein
LLPYKSAVTISILFTFDEKLKSEEKRGEYIVFRPNGVLLCYSKKMANVPFFPTSIYFYYFQCKIGNQFFELNPKRFERMPTMKEFYHLRAMKDYRVTGRQRASREIEVPIEHQAFSEDSERVVSQYYDECLSLYRRFLHPDNRDQNIIKVFSEEGTLVCGLSLPKEIPYIHKCKPGLQDLSLNTKLFSKIPTWGDYKSLEPYLEVADYDNEHE